MGIPGLGTKATMLRRNASALPVIREARQCVSPGDLECCEVAWSPPVGTCGLARFHVFERAAHLVACGASQAMLEGAGAGDASAR